MHEIRVLVAPITIAELIIQQVHFATGFAASNGWQVLPLSPRVLEGLVGRKVVVPDLEDPAASELFTTFCRVVISALSTRATDLTGVVAVTQYWGGAGTQAAVAVSSGADVFPPSVSTEAINRALASLSCPLLPGLDAFDSVGLGRWRNMDSFGMD